MKNRFLIILIVAALVQVGCLKEHSDYKSPKPTIDGSVYDFATTTSSVLNFKFDTSENYVVAFEVYTEYPFEKTVGENIALKSGIQPVEKGFTDGKGGYSRLLTLPSYVSDIYIYTTNIGVANRLLKASIENGVISTPVAVGLGAEGPVAVKTSRSTRAGFSINADEAGTFNSNISSLGLQTKTLGKWYIAKDGPNCTTLVNGREVKLFGRPVEMSYVDKTRFEAAANVKNALAISPSVLSAINIALPGDGKGAVDEKYLNTGDIHVKTEAELDLVFIQNWGAYCNTLAYYCYETANPPQSISDVKFQVIAIPNAMEHKFDFSLSSSYDVAAFYRGEGVKLKYIDADGKLLDKFPAGTSVGWILYRDGFSKPGTDSELGPVMRMPSLGNGANISSRALTQNPNTAVLRVGDFVVIGFDDGEGVSATRDYLDLVFNVQSTPSDAITEAVPDVRPEAPKPVVIKNQGVLLYEDIWPYQGDFDMNDVVVKYVAEKTKDNTNAVTAAKIDFTILHSGASYNNTFAYEDPNIANAEVTVTGGEGATVAAEVDKVNNIVYVAKNLLDYANKADKVTFTVNYKYNTPIADYQDAPFNPFILAGSTAGKEVHLTNYKPSSVADLGWFKRRAHDFSNPDKGIYYVTYDNYSATTPDKLGVQLPWAVEIVFDSVEALDTFKVTVEGKRIDYMYPDFLRWIYSGGTNFKDWYLRYVE